MTIFDDYKKYKDLCSVSPTLLWEYNLSDFDWWKSRKIVVQRILERGWLKDFYAAFNIYGGDRGISGDSKGDSLSVAQGYQFCMYCI